MAQRFKVEYTKAAVKDIKSLDKITIGKALKSLEKLMTDHLSGHALQGSLKGARSLEFSSRGGAYRALYKVDEPNKKCIVFMIGPHENIYAEAPRRYLKLK